MLHKELRERYRIIFGVPQISVHEPMLFCMYTKSVSDTVHHFGLLHHSYADDTQLCITIKKQDSYRALCVSEIQVWMNHNMLNKLTEFKQNVNTFAE